MKTQSRAEAERSILAAKSGLRSWERAADLIIKHYPKEPILTWWTEARARCAKQIAEAEVVILYADLREWYEMANPHP